MDRLYYTEDRSIFVQALNQLPLDQHPRLNEGIPLHSLYKHHIPVLVVRDPGPFVHNSSENYKLYSLRYPDNLPVEPLSREFREKLLTQPLAEVEGFVNHSSLVLAYNTGDRELFYQVLEAHKEVSCIFDIHNCYGDGLLDYICMALDLEALQKVMVLAQQKINYSIPSGYGGNPLHWLFCAAQAHCRPIDYHANRIAEMVLLLSKYDACQLDSFGRKPDDYAI
jgi:hypothetical protein